MECFLLVLQQLLAVVDAAFELDSASWAEEEEGLAVDLPMLFKLLLSHKLGVFNLFILSIIGGLSQFVVKALLDKLPLLLINRFIFGVPVIILGTILVLFSLLNIELDIFGRRHFLFSLLLLLFGISFGFSCCCTLSSSSFFRLPSATSYLFFFRFLRAIVSRFLDLLFPLLVPFGILLLHLFSEFIFLFLQPLLLTSKFLT